MSNTAVIQVPKVGDSIGTTHKTVYQRSLVERQFSADSIHNNAYTKAAGYPGALVSAYVLAGYMSELLVDFFGESWLTTRAHVAASGAHRSCPVPARQIRHFGRRRARHDCRPR